MRRTLIILAVALTAVALFAAEADFWVDHRFSPGHHFHSTTILTSLRVAHGGEIELDEAQTRILSMSPDAFLEVGERRFITRRRLEVRPDAAGRPQYKFTRGSRQRSEEDAREFLALVMEDVVRSTTLGAHARGRRILASESLDGLLEEVARLDSNSVRRIYIELAASAEGLDEEDAARIVRTAGREINSSSRLRSALVFMAEKFPFDWAISGALIEAAEHIASSSQKGETLIELVRIRGLEIEDAPAMGEALSTIASSGEIVRAVQKITRLAPSPEIVEQMLEPVSRLSSSSYRRQALVELISYPGLSESTYRRALEVSRDIVSSGERAAFLGALAAKMPAVERMQRQYLKVAGGIASSGDQANALTALLRGTAVSAGLCRMWIQTAGQISSSGTATSLLVEASRRCPDGEGVWSAYLEAVRDISSSGDQRRALMALLEREELDPKVVEEVASVATLNMASSGESQRVMERAQSLLASQSVPTD